MARASASGASGSNDSSLRGSAASSPGRMPKGESPPDSPVAGGGRSEGRSVSRPPARLAVRTQLASRAAALVGRTSRALRRGDGTVIGGQVALAIDPHALGKLAAGRLVVLVSGTNGKTTTTKLLAESVGARSAVLTNEGGANLPGGLVAALATGARGAPAVLEVDEGYLGMVAEVVAPGVIVLLNLSRDQLDRVSEVRMQADKWRAALARLKAVHVVANCDDPLVVWAASAAATVTWVAGGQSWRGDSAGCPRCSGRLVYAASDGWSCACGFDRPDPDVWVEGGVMHMKVAAPGPTTAPGPTKVPGPTTVPRPTAAVAPRGTAVESWPIDLPLPGRCNLSNASMAAAAAKLMGVDVAESIAAMAKVDEVAGRYGAFQLDGVEVRMLLAKNPAGWMELLDLLAGGSRPLVVAINARIADGQDPSWLWDVPFERLAGRRVVASGARCWDLAVRLTYANVPHITTPNLPGAIVAAGEPVVDFAGNYTAFQDLRAHMRRARSGVVPAVSTDGDQSMPAERGPATSRRPAAEPAAVGTEKPEELR